MNRMVFFLVNFVATSPQYHILLSDCRAYKIWPRLMFWTVKKSYKVSYVSSLYEFARLVESSSNAGVNKAQIVATHDGRVIVPVYDWVSFLGEHFKKIPNLKKFHHFAFSKETPGMVSCKESVYSPSQSFMLLKNPIVFPNLQLFLRQLSPMDSLMKENNTYTAK